MTLTSLIETLKEAIRDIGAIMFMISMSAIFAYGIPMDQIPQKLTTFITSFTSSQFVVMGIVFVLYVIFGMFMDGSIVILLLTPILMPIVRTIGIDPVLFGGVITSIIVTMGILTPPPVGIAMYIVNGILDVKMSEYMKESIPPFFIVVILVGILLLAIPDVILFLPNLVYGT